MQRLHLKQEHDRKLDDQLETRLAEVVRALGKQKEMGLKREWGSEDREVSPALAKSLAFTPTEIFAQNNLTSLG